MANEQIWALGCGGCGKEIKKEVSWFKQSGNVCPHCSRPIDPNQIEKILGEIKKNLADLSMDDDDDIEFNI